MVKLVNPQEVIVWDIIPFLRKALAISLTKKGISQKNVAETLGITPAAVSQYINSKRARNLDISKKLSSEIDNSAESLKNHESSSLEEIQRLVSLDEVKELACDIHKKEYGADKNCDICFS